MSRTLVEEISHQAEIKRSRFVARAAAAANEDEARAFLERVADPGATHNCWAFRAGDNYRFDDNGEPGGTAGRPILQAIESQDFDQVVVVVTRYFGGVKLGTGGLARAYGGTAAEALRQAESTPIVKRIRLLARVPFDCIDAAHRTMEAHDAAKLDEHYDCDGVELILALPERSRDAFVESLRDLARGAVSIRWI